MGSAKNDSTARLSPLLRRAVILAALLIGCAVVYGTILARSDLSRGPDEAELGTPAGRARVALYVQPIQIDAVNESMQVRISVVPLSDAKVTIADRDFLLTIQRGGQVDHVQIQAGQLLPEVTFGLDLHEGDVRDYPLDRYVSLMTLAASERAQDGNEKSLPIHVTAWEGVLGFDVKAKSVSLQPSEELQLQFAVSRTGGVAFFGVAIYGAMLVMMLCALIIGSLVFLSRHGRAGAHHREADINRMAMTSPCPLWVRSRPEAANVRCRLSPQQ